MPVLVMVWWGILYFGATHIHFYDPDVKMYGEVYRAVLNDFLPPLEETVFRNEDESCFQQDSASAHKIKNMQKWLQEYVPEFNEADDWLSSSPDFNPLGYKLWLVLQECVCAWRPQNLDSLKAVREIPPAMICEAIDDWPKRLRHCMQAKGGHFE